MPTKPTFFSSVLSGIAGYVKGMIVGGVTGGAVGAAVGAVIGIAALLVGGATLPLIPAMLAIGGMAMGGAVLGGSFMAGIGALSGTVTGVVKSREASQPSTQDVLNVANISFAQGVESGRAMEQQQEETKWRDRYAKEKATPEQSQRAH